MLKSQPVDAVVLDYRMPEMDGAQVACEIRKNHPELPIVLLSGYIAEIPPDLRGNVNRFVAKGSPPESLLVALEETIGSRPAKNLDAVASILDETQEQVARSRDHLGRASSHLSQSKKVIEKNVEHLQNLRRKKV
jgi:CheY-like chemotaxis protein